MRCVLWGDADREGSQGTAGMSVTEQAVQRKQRERLSAASEQYRRARQRVQAALDRAELLRDAPGRGEDGDVTLAMDDLMRERGYISSAGTVADSIVEQALATHDVLEQQRARMGASRHKLGRFEGITASAQKVMEKIGWKKRKNAIILAVVIAACLIFLFWWWASG